MMASLFTVNTHVRRGRTWQLEVTWLLACRLPWEQAGVLIDQLTQVLKGRQFICSASHTELVLLGCWVRSVSNLYILPFVPAESFRLVLIFLWLYLIILTQLFCISLRWPAILHNNNNTITRLNVVCLIELLMSRSCSTIIGVNKSYNDASHGPCRCLKINVSLFFFKLFQAEHASVNLCHQQKGVVSRDGNLRLYIPCRTECVWSFLSHRLGSRGVYERWLTIHANRREGNPHDCLQSALILPGSLWCTLPLFPAAGAFLAVVSISREVVMYVKLSCHPNWASMSALAELWNSSFLCNWIVALRHKFKSPGRWFRYT